MSKQFTFKINDNLNMIVQYAGQGKENFGWEFFRWIATIKDQSFEFKTGLAWQLSKNENSFYFPYQKSIKLAKENGQTIYYDQDNSRYLIVPNEKDILPSLLLDSEAASMSFNDFCDRFGYDNDSLHALDTYRACMSIKEKILKVMKLSDLEKFIEE